MSHEVNQRVDNTICVEERDGEYLRHFVTHWYAPDVGDNSRRVSQQAGHNDASSRDQEQSRPQFVLDEEEHHGHIEDEDEEEGQNLKKDLLVVCVLP